MALDGVFLRHTAKEIEQAALGARVDKIYQPNREEIIVSLRSREGAVRLLLSARANSARIHITEHVPENPKQPPMLCMLLRKTGRCKTDRGASNRIGACSCSSI